MIALATAKLPFCLFSIRQTRLLYSQPPLAAWVPAHIQILRDRPSCDGPISAVSQEPTAGLEPATVRLQGGCSTELSYVGLPYSRHCSTQRCLTKKNSCKPTAWQHYGSIRRSACFVKCQESEALKPATQSLPDHHR